MKRLFLSILFISTTIISQAITFGGPLNDYGRNLIRTNDNGYALLSQYSDTTKDLYLVKLDASANLQWTKQIGNGGDDYTGDIIQTADSGFIIIGTTGDSIGNLHAWLLRLNANGDSIWTKTYGTDPNTIFQGVYAEVYSPTQYSIGIVRAEFTGNSDLILLRTDTTGIVTDTIWLAQFGQSITKHGSDYLVTGITNVVTPDATSLLRFDSTGVNIFTSIYFDNNLISDVSGFSTTPCGNGTLTAGSTNLYTASTNFTEFYLMRTDSAGDSLWTKHWGDSTSVFTFIINDNHDEFYAAGYTEGLPGIRNNFIMKIDSTGDTLWTKNIGPDLNVNEILITEYGFAVIGDSLNQTTTDIWFMRYDTLGHELDSLQTGIINSIDEYDLKVFPNPSSNSLYVTLNTPGLLELSIENLSGETVYKGKINENAKIDISKYSNGHYILKIYSGSKIITRKFIKA